MFSILFFILCRILKRNVEKAGLIIQPDVADKIVSIVARGRRLEGFGNAGAVETILGRAKLNKSRRLAATALEGLQSIDMQEEEEDYDDDKSEIPSAHITPGKANTPIIKKAINQDLLLLEDFIAEDISVQKAKEQFRDMYNCDHLLTLIDHLEATLAVAKAERKPTADLLSNYHMVFTGSVSYCTALP